MQSKFTIENKKKKKNPDISRPSLSLSFALQGWMYASLFQDVVLLLFKTPVSNATQGFLLDKV